MFAENQRISSLQMERQFMLTYFGPMLLWGSTMFYGRVGIAGILAGSLVLSIWNFFLHRHTGIYRNPEKYWGKYMSKFVFLLCEIYLILAGSWLVIQTSKIIGEYFLSGTPKWLIMGILVLAALGGCHNIQARGRFAQVVWPGLHVIFLILFLWAAFQGREEFVYSMIQETWVVSDVIAMTGTFVGFFLGITFLPFLNVKTDGHGLSTKISFRMIGKMTLWMLGISILLFLYYGDNGAQSSQYPLLDFFAGVKLPGGFIRRLDLVFLTLVCFMLLFSLGSIFFYGAYLSERFGISWGKIPVVIGICLLCINLMGCQVVEPEKRAYPLAIGLDWNQETQQYEMYLAMVSLSESTGQGKTGEESSGQNGYLFLSGQNQEQIMEKYNSTQNLYLDVGHVQAVILGQGILEDQEKMQQLLWELEKEQTLGNGAYVFRTDRMDEVFAKNGENKDSLGMFLTEIYENRKEATNGVSLSQVYRKLHKEDTIKLPAVYVAENQLYVEKSLE